MMFSDGHFFWFLNVPIADEDSISFTPLGEGFHVRHDVGLADHAKTSKTSNASHAEKALPQDDGTTITTLLKDVREARPGAASTRVNRIRRACLDCNTSASIAASTPFLRQRLPEQKPALVH